VENKNALATDPSIHQMRQRFGDHMQKQHPKTSGEQLNELQGVGPLHHNLNGIATPMG
jgi:hypothetical protein